MAKKQVTRITFQSMNIAFRGLCLLGLTWHITHISINFFHFDVIRDIKVIMPEEINDTKQVLNICFENEDIINHTKFVKYIPDPKRVNPELEKERKKTEILKFPVRIRYNLTSNNASLFGKHPNVEEFIIGPLYCYQFVEPIGINGSKLRMKNVTFIAISRGEPLPLFDHRRLVRMNDFPTDFRNNMRSHRISIQSYMYFIKKLPWPYTDNCKDYSTPEFKNRLQAVSNCINRLSLNGTGKLYSNKIVRSRSKYLNNTCCNEDNIEYEKTCIEANPKLDCSVRVHMTGAVLKVVSNDQSKQTKPASRTVGSEISAFSRLPISGKVVSKKVFFSIGENSDPSFFIESKPRIDDIDYLTYILGSLGAWIGFSFISINPIPYIFSVIGDIRIRNGTKTTNCDILHKKLEKRMILQEQLTQLKSAIELRKIDNTIKSLEYQHIATKKTFENMFKTLIKDVSDMKRKISTIE